MPQKAQRGSRGIPLFVLNLGPRYGWVVKATLQVLYSRRKRRMLPTVGEAEWAPGPVQTGVGKKKYFDPTGIPIPEPSSP